MALKDEWKNTGKGLGQAFADLGKTLVKTAKYGVDKADEWVEEDSASKSANDTTASGKKPQE